MGFRMDEDWMIDRVGRDGEGKGRTGHWTDSGLLDGQVCKGRAPRLQQEDRSETDRNVIDDDGDDNVGHQERMSRKTRDRKGLMVTEE